MYHELLFDATFWTFLFRIDRKLAEEVRAEKCPSCGFHLHHANYPRKPRGPRDLPDEYRYRLSFCCARDRNGNEKGYHDAHENGGQPEI